MDRDGKPRFHGRRRGRPLGPTQARLIAEALPRLSVDPTTPPADPARLFDPPRRRLWLEIGFGAGEHLAELAGANPDVGFIGCEPYINGVAKLLRAVKARGLGNVRVLADDARLLLTALPEACLERAYILFPDPWPKARHKRRRLVNGETVAEIARLLIDGGELRLASDHGDYVAWMLKACLEEPALDWTARGPADWRARPDGEPATRYETKALAGRPVYLTWRRRARDGGSRIGPCGTGRGEAI